MRKLPNLNATRAFESAARHGSFAAAAEELGVSHAAVSRHVRNLEMQLGVELFERHARHVVLTGEGSLFARTVARSFADLALGAGRLRQGTAKGTVVVDVETDLAVMWLMPNLTAEVLDELRLNVDLRCRPDPPRSLPGDVDLVLTWGPAALIGFRSETFLDLKTFPVASPELVANGPDPSSPEFYAVHRLIHERGLYWWRRYFADAGVRLDDLDNHLFFNRAHLCINAALRGLGIAIGDHLSCGEHLRSGRLIQLPGPVLPGRDQYYLLTPDTAHLSQPARKLRDWLREGAQMLKLQVDRAQPVSG